jgi:hypothetical protein
MQGVLRSSSRKSTPHEPLQGNPLNSVRGRRALRSAVHCHARCERRPSKSPDHSGTLSIYEWSATHNVENRGCCRGDQSQHSGIIARTDRPRLAAQPDACHGARPVTVSAQMPDTVEGIKWINLGKHLIRCAYATCWDFIDGETSTVEDAIPR